MRKSPPTDLRLMRCFVAVAEAQHVGKAADRLGLAQSAVSRAVQKLEVELGRELITRRHGRSGELTQAGRITLAAGRELLQRYEELVTKLAELDSADG